MYGAHPVVWSVCVRSSTALRATLGIEPSSRRRPYRTSCPGWPKIDVVSILPLTVRCARRGEVTQTDQTTGWAQCVNIAQIFIKILHNDSRWCGGNPIRDRHPSGTGDRTPMDGLSVSRIGLPPYHLLHHSSAILCWNPQQDRSSPASRASNVPCYDPSGVSAPIKSS